MSSRLRHYAQVYIFVSDQGVTDSSSTILKFVGLCNFRPAVVMPKLLEKVSMPSEWEFQTR